MLLSFKRLVRPPRPPQGKRRVLGGFVAFDGTINDLVARLLELGASESTIGLDFDLSDMRPDGWPRANVVPRTPGVVLLVECRVGPLLFSCDTYVHWLHNLHALVLVLDNLHKASLHNAVSASELYAPFRPPGLNTWLAGKPFALDLSLLRVTLSGKGKWTATTRTADAWASSRASEPPPPRAKAAPPPPPPRTQSASAESFATRLKAATWLADKTGVPSSQLLGDERAFVEAYRLAARTMHPDVGGDAAQFRRLQNAKAVIERGAPWAK